MYDSLTINDGTGLDGFNSNSLSGTKRVLLTFQTQTYSPWNIAGFRFGPYFTYGIGMIGNNQIGLKKNSLYSQLGVGLLIKNENLVFNTFQISLAFYPKIPGIGQDIFKMNAFNTNDFGLRDFEFNKPEISVFR